MNRLALGVVALSMLAISPAAKAQITVGNQTFDVNGLSLEYEANLNFSKVPINGSVLHVDGTANATAVCINPDGRAPKDLDPIAVSTPITVSGTETIPGKFVNPLAVFVTTNPPPAIPGAPDCNNSNWAERVTELDLTSAIVTLLDPTQDIQFQEVCQFNPALTSAIPRSC